MDQQNSLLLAIAELFNDPISSELLTSPRLLGKHTFSSNTIMRLTKFEDEEGNKYIYHPFTREIFYLNSIEELPKNSLVEILLLVFNYCKQNKLDNICVKNIFAYFIKIILYNTLFLQQSPRYLRLDEIIQDFLLKDLMEVMELKLEIYNMLPKQLDLKLLDLKNHKPAEMHLNKILFMSIKFNNNQLTNLLLLEDLKIDIHLKDQKGKTSFFWACYHSQVLLAKLLFKLGADLYIRDQYNKTVFAYMHPKQSQKFLNDFHNQIVDPNIDWEKFYNKKQVLLWNYQHKKAKNKDPAFTWQIVKARHSHNFINTLRITY